MNALSALDLFSSSGSTVTDSHDPPEEIAVDHGQTAASVGRAIYEVLRVDPAGKTRRIYVKRRDLLRANGLQPRDLRRIDPSLSLTKTSPNITIKENVLVINLGGVRSVIRADKCLLFEPNSVCSQKFLDILCPRLQAAEGHERQQNSIYSQDEEKPPPFELEILEAALMVATGRLDAELVSVSKRVSNVLMNLPRDITPVNLEELRRVKQCLVELESKADNLRDMLEELMDDDDEVCKMNLTSRPKREERRRLRERERLERGMEREREMARSSAASSSSEIGSHDGAGNKGRSSSSEEWERRNMSEPGTATSSAHESQTTPRTSSSSLLRAGRWDSDRDRGYEEDGEGYVEAEAALEEMDDAEMEEREVEETEDLLEYYLQRAAGTQSEAERLLAGARDLEESIGVSLSARRFEVNRLELTLSIGSFAAALGAMVAGIFGMNLRSTLEDSVIGFWGTTVGIVLCCVWVFFALFSYTRRRRIL
ncbi:g7316 [Coccomyxa elongata]